MAGVSPMQSVHEVLTLDVFALRSDATAVWYRREVLF